MQLYLFIFFLNEPVVVVRNAVSLELVLNCTLFDLRTPCISATNMLYISGLNFVCVYRDGNTTKIEHIKCVVLNKQFILIIFFVFSFDVCLLFSHNPRHVKNEQCRLKSRKLATTRIFFVNNNTTSTVHRKINNFFHLENNILCSIFT